MMETTVDERRLSGTARRGSNAPVSSDTAVTLGGTALLVVDPQMDFHEGGSLAVPGATADSERTAKFIAKHSEILDEVVITLDSHQSMDIAHPYFWVDRNGSHPAPFQKITADDVQKGKWTPVQDEYQEHCVEYTKRLRDGGKFTLCIWPVHCLIGTPGHAVNPLVNNAAQRWAVQKRKKITYMMKGQNTLSEHYSCFMAEVQVPGDDANERGRLMMAKLCALDRVLVCGQAASHCVNHSVRDLAAAWKGTTAGASEQKARERMANLVVLKDCTSTVPGFERETEEFYADMASIGVSISTSEEALAKVVPCDSDE